MSEQSMPESAGEIKAPKRLLNIDANNPDAITMFNPYGGPPPMLVEGRFVMPKDRWKWIKQHGSADKNSSVHEK